MEKAARVLGEIKNHCSNLLLKETLDLEILVQICSKSRLRLIKKNPKAAASI